MEKFIMAGGCAVRISDTEKGSCTIVLLHGYLESLDVWDDFTKLISKQARVVAIDLPGHGVSEVKGEIHTMEFMADVVYGALAKLGVEKPVIVGHSMGGYVALEFIRKYPDYASGLVLFHSTANPDTEKKKADREREIDLITGGKKELIARSFPHVGFAPGNRERLTDKIEELSEQIILTEDEGIIAVLRGIRDREDMNEMMRSSKLPQLIILGRFDEYITPEIAEEFVKGQPQAKVVWLEESGHMGFEEEPQKGAQAILDFAAEVCPG